VTVDDLARLICETQNVDGFKCTCPVPFEPDWCNGNRAKAQARAVVRALRDETRHMTLNRDGLEELFTQILGDAGEKVAGGSTREDGPGGVEQAVPALTLATAAAPAVCVWNPNAKGWWVASCDKRYSFRKSALSKLSECPECNAPIKFTEAK